MVKLYQKYIFFIEPQNCITFGIMSQGDIKYSWSAVSSSLPMLSSEKWEKILNYVTQSGATTIVLI